jgi:hypothetical protein
MEDHETRRKVIRQWMTLPKDKRHSAEQAAEFAKKTVERTNFRRAGVTRMREWWDGFCQALVNENWNDSQTNGAGDSRQSDAAPLAADGRLRPHHRAAGRRCSGADLGLQLASA